MKRRVVPRDGIHYLEVPEKEREYQDKGIEYPEEGRDYHEEPMRCEEK